MKRTLAILALAGAGMVTSGGSVLAAPSTTQSLPTAACNQGTMNAHERMPETTGNGKTTPGHAAVPGTANVTPCGHGG